MKSVRFSTAIVTSLAAAAFLPTIAYAQSDEPEVEQKSHLDVVVVTARKAEENLQETPVAVTAISAKDIEAQQLTFATDIQRAAPGLMSRGAGTGPSAIVTFALRGNAQNSPNSVTDSAVGVYLDGVYLARAISSNLGFLDVSDVQVVRGTQGTLFGRNTTGGAVQFTTVQPDGDATGYVKAGIGNYDQRMVESAATIPLMGDELSMRLAGRYAERDGYGKNLETGQPLGDIESDISTRATIRWAPEEIPLTFTLSGDYIKSNDNGTMNRVVAVNPTGPLATLFPGQFSLDMLRTEGTYYDSPGFTVTKSGEVNKIMNRNRAYGVSGTLEFEVGDVTVKSITAYRDSNSGNAADLDSTPAGGISFYSEYLQDQISQELQASGSSGPFDWIVGAYYFKETGEERSDSYALSNVPALGGLSLAPSGRNLSDFESKSSALFAQTNYNITDALRLTAGIRYTWDERSIVGHGVDNITGAPEAVFAGGGVVIIQPETCRVGPNAGTTDPALCNAPFDASFDYPAWTLGLDYQINEDLMVYAKTGGASLSGGFNTRPAPTGLESFEPENVKDVEFGFKGQFIDNRLQTNLAVFHVWREDAQNIVNGIVNGGLTQFTQNSGNIKSYGAELEVKASPWEGMQLSGAVSRLWSEYESGTFLDLGVGGTFDRSDETVAQTPEWTFNLGATQTFETEFGNAAVHFDYAFMDDRNFGQETADLTDPTLTQEQIDTRLANVAIANQLSTLDSYGELNGRITFLFDDPGLELAFWGRNLTDEQYSQNLFASYNQLGFVSNNAGNPRTYGMTVTLDW